MVKVGREGKNKHFLLPSNFFILFYYKHNYIINYRKIDNVNLVTVLIRFLKLILSTKHSVICQQETLSLLQTRSTSTIIYYYSVRFV